MPSSIRLIPPPSEPSHRRIPPCLPHPLVTFTCQPPSLPPIQQAMNAPAPPYPSYCATRRSIAFGVEGEGVSPKVDVGRDEREGRDKGSGGERGGGMGADLGHGEGYWAKQVRNREEEVWANGREEGEREERGERVKAEVKSSERGQRNSESNLIPLWRRTGESIETKTDSVTSDSFFSSSVIFPPRRFFSSYSVELLASEVTSDEAMVRERFAVVSRCRTGRSRVSEREVEKREDEPFILASIELCPCTPILNNDQSAVFRRGGGERERQKEGRRTSLKRFS